MKTGKKVKIKFVKDRPGHDFRYALNNKKALKKIKWKSKKFGTSVARRGLVFWKGNKSEKSGQWQK